MRDIIIKIVGLRGAVRAVDLILAVMEHVNPQIFKYDQYVQDLRACIKSGEIVELSYTTEEHYKPRLKSVFFPAETKFNNLKELREANERTDQSLLVRKS